MDIKAVIFDLNGTILTDEDEYGRAFISVLKSLGVNVEKDPHIAGIGVKENWLRLKQKYNITTSKTDDELSSLTQKEYIKLIDKVSLKEGFCEFAEKLKQEGIPMALATSNTYLIVEKIFEKFDIEKYFDVVTTSEEVLHNKPNPEIYELTADKLDVKPEECIVFEDSQAGIDAAKAAGMKAIALLCEDGTNQELKGWDSKINNFIDLEL